jgi:hypothetical protein
MDCDQNKDDPAAEGDTKRKPLRGKERQQLGRIIANREKKQELRIPRLQTLKTIRSWLTYRVAERQADRIDAATLNAYTQVAKLLISLVEKTTNEDKLRRLSRKLAELTPTAPLEVEEDGDE